MIAHFLYNIYEVLFLRHEFDLISSVLIFCHLEKKEKSMCSLSSAVMIMITTLNVVRKPP